MIDRTHKLALKYQVPSGSREDLDIMRRIDALHLDYPYTARPMLRALLRGDGFEIGREAGLTDEAHGNQSDISQAEHVQASARTQDLPLFAVRISSRSGEPSLGNDIAYIPMSRAFVYLAAVVECIRAACSPCVF